jgi:hypothetical protein
MNKTLLESCHGMEQDAFLGCLRASVVCIELGRTAHLLGMGCTRVILKSAVWYLKLWQIMTSGFGMLSSGWGELTMISMCCSDLLCLQDWLEDMLRQLNLRSMATLTTKGTTSMIVSIRNGLHLWITFLNPSPSTEKKSHFANCQEAYQKDVERAFGVFQHHFAIVRYPALTWLKS